MDPGRGKSAPARADHEKLLRRLAKVQEDRDGWLKRLTADERRLLHRWQRHGCGRGLDETVEHWEGVVATDGNGGALAEKRDAFSRRRRECFSQFLVSTVGGYRDFCEARDDDAEGPLRASTSEPDASSEKSTRRRTFDASGFASSRPDATSRKWAAKLANTQLFHDFIREARSVPETPGSDKRPPPREAAVRWFDESVVAKANRKALTLQPTDTPFLSSDAYASAARDVPLI